MKEFFDRSYESDYKLQEKCSRVPIYPLSGLLLNVSIFRTLPYDVKDNLDIFITGFIVVFALLILCILPCPCFCHPYEKCCKSKRDDKGMGVQAKSDSPMIHK